MWQMRNASRNAQRSRAVHHPLIATSPRSRRPINAPALAQRVADLADARPGATASMMRGIRAARALRCPRRTAPPPRRTSPPPRRAPRARAATSSRRRAHRAQPRDLLPLRAPSSPAAGSTGALLAIRERVHAHDDRLPALDAQLVRVRRRGRSPPGRSPPRSPAPRRRARRPARAARARARSSSSSARST